jgi:hypothetical protein
MRTKKSTAHKRSVSKSINRQHGTKQQSPMFAIPLKNTGRTLRERARYADELAEGDPNAADRKSNVKTSSVELGAAERWGARLPPVSSTVHFWNSRQSIFLKTCQSRLDVCQIYSESARDGFDITCAAPGARSIGPGALLTTLPVICTRVLRMWAR